MLEKGWSEDYARQVEGELKKFFAAALLREPSQVVCPNMDVDELWHAMVLHTGGYREFCRGAFGRFLDRGPDDGSPGSGRLLRGGYSMTVTLITDLYGAADETIWGPGNQGDCCGGYGNWPCYGPGFGR